MEPDNLIDLRVETTCNTSDKELLKNLEAFKESGIESLKLLPGIDSRPLMICGSGPSLSRYFPAAKEMFPNSPVMALNGAYNALLDMGCVPDYYVQLDARAVNVNFVSRPQDKTSYYLASQCHPDMFRALKGFEVTGFHLNTPTTLKVLPGQQAYLGGGATVGSTAMGLAALLGYRTIGLFGYDSSYEDGKSHVIDQPQNAKQNSLDVWYRGKKYHTSCTMAQQVTEFRPWCATLMEKFPGFDIRLFGDGLLYDYILSGQQAEAA